MPLNLLQRALAPWLDRVALFGGPQLVAANNVAFNAPLVVPNAALWQHKRMMRTALFVGCWLLTELLLWLLNDQADPAWFSQRVAASASHDVASRCSFR